jgi:3-phosphoshikimate 1-carboxyvinyltransferase
MREIRTIDNLDATVGIPGSKSITHRYLIMAALAEGSSQLRNSLWSDDTRYTATALQEFGAEITHSPNGIEVIGTAGDLDCPSESLYLDNAGTAMRLLTAVACLCRGSCILFGSERMHRRPVAELLDGLQLLGANIECLEEKGYPPLRVYGNGLRGGHTTVNASRSSQFVSAILLAAPYASRPVEITVKGLVSRPYVEVTLDEMSRFGATAGWIDGKMLRVEAPGRYLGGTYDVEGDCSSASYFWSAAAITGGKISTLNIHSTSRQGDLAFLDLLCQMGCRAEWGTNGVTVYGGELRGMEVDMQDMPDMVPTLAVTAAFAQGKTVIYNVGHLRLKESDRLRAIAEGLQRLGIKVIEEKDRLTIIGGNPRGAVIDPHNDHRIAMSFAVAGLVAKGVRISHENCVEKSFPQVWATFEQLYG